MSDDQVGIATFLQEAQFIRNNIVRDIGRLYDDISEIKTSISQECTRLAEAASRHHKMATAIMNSQFASQKVVINEVYVDIPSAYVENSIRDRLQKELQTIQLLIKSLDEWRDIVEKIQRLTDELVYDEEPEGQSDST